MKSLDEFRILLEEGMARVGRVRPPRGRRRWVGRGSGRSGRRLGSAHPRLHRVPVVGKDESLEHLGRERRVVVEV